MRGHIGVKFDDDGKVYTYMIPDHINPKDIDKYVVVEDVFGGRTGSYLYKVAKVVWVDADGSQFMSTAGYKPTKYIVDYIGKKPTSTEKKPPVKKWPLVDFVWNMLTIEEKTDLIKNYLDTEYIAK